MQLIRLDPNGQERIVDHLSEIQVTARLCPKGCDSTVFFAHSTWASGVVCLRLS